MSNPRQVVSIVMAVLIAIWLIFLILITTGHLVQGDVGPGVAFGIVTVLFALLLWLAIRGLVRRSAGKPETDRVSVLVDLGLLLFVVGGLLALQFAR